MAKRKKGSVVINGYKYEKKQVTGPDGKRKTFYGKTKTEANEKARRYLEETRGKNNEGSNITFKEYAERQLGFIVKKVDRRTYDGYESKVRLHINPLIGDMMISDITQDDIQGVLSSVAHMSKSYYSTTHMLLRRIFKAAKNSQLINHDPTKGIEGTGGQSKKERPALTDKQVELLLKTVKGLKVETFCRVGVYTGLRREEILGLKWKYVHLDDDTPYIEVENAWRTENNRPVVSDKLKSNAARRKIPIPTQLATYLREQKREAMSDYVVCNRDGNALTDTQWRNLWKQVTRRVAEPHKYVRYKNGKKEEHWVTPEFGSSAVHNPQMVYALNFSVTPHQLRYTYVTNLIYKGLDPKTVQYLAGHESIKITMEIYARTKYNQPTELAGPVNEAFEGFEV